MSKAVAASSSPYTLDPDQTLRAATALLSKIRADAEEKATKTTKPSLLQDADDTSDAATDDTTPIWLTLTTKKHVSDKKRLKPGKIALPHSLHSTSSAAGPLRICLITADPQRTYKDLVDMPAFPADLSKSIARVIGCSKLKEKYHSYESKRQLVSEYDIFLADDRIVTNLPVMLGKTFYTQGNKRPVPVSLQGRKDDSRDASGNKRLPLAQGGTKVTRQPLTPAALAKEVQRAIDSALVHLSPSVTTSIRVAHSGMTSAQVAENVEAVVTAALDKYVPKGWSNLRAIHVKGPETAALPIWLASELWVDDGDVLEEAPVLKNGKNPKNIAAAAAKKERKNAARQALISKGAAKAVDETDTQKLSDGKKKRKSRDGEDAGNDDAAASRKDLLKKQKKEARSAV